MDTFVFKESEWAEKVFQELLRQVKSGIRHVFLPAGSTARPLFARMRVMSEDEYAQLKNIQWYQLDEVEKKFEMFFKEELPEKLLVNFHNLDKVNVENFDFKNCLCILGVGQNGHVAFHEPAFMDHLFLNACVKLDENSANTVSVSTKTWATTLGLGFFMRAKEVILLLRGTEKREIWKRMNSGQKLPVCRLFSHPRLQIFLEETVVEKN